MIRFIGDGQRLISSIEPIDEMLPGRLLPVLFAPAKHLGVFPLDIDSLISFVLLQTSKPLIVR